MPALRIALSSLLCVGAALVLAACDSDAGRVVSLTAGREAFYAACQDEVRKKLTSPETAVFPTIGEAALRFGDGDDRSLSGSVITSESGTPRPTTFICKVEFDPFREEFKPMDATVIPPAPRFPNRARTP